MKKAELEQQILEMKHIDDSITKMEKYKYRRFFAFGTIASAAYLVGGTHAVYNVEWLGWDRVEPLTYTVSQGFFIMGLFYILRMKNREEIRKGLSEDNDSSAENCIWIPEYGLYDPMRKKNLTEELEKVVA